MTSLYQQTRAPDEIIVIDGGSTDGTYEYLQEQADEKKIIVYRHPSNIAEARNFAVQKAHHDIILCTDAWCQVDQHRCAEIMHVYETTDEKVVGGKSGLIAHNTFQHNAKHRFVSPDPDFHFVSSRNISFYKQVRKEVGWYPEYLTKRGEDTYFNYKIEQAGYKIFYCAKAIVQWHMGKDYQSFYKMFRNYTQGDAEVFVIHHTIQSYTIRQSIVFSICCILLLLCIGIGWRYGILIILWAVLGIGLYKRSIGGFWFDLRFSMAKIIGTTIGFRKWIYQGYQIRKIMKKGK